MRVCRLKLSRFRNYQELDLAPGPGLNILYGENAQGKSNVLEALSLLATTRSPRASRDAEMILRGNDEATVTAEVIREREGEAELQVSILQGDKKSVRVNGSKRPRVVDLLGQFNAIFFASIELSIVTGEPSARRHYLNMEISQISPRYVYDLAHYKRTLEQRNRLLRDLRDRGGSPQESGLDAWNAQLVTHGSPLFDRRRFYIDRLAPLADRVHRTLTDGHEGLQLKYLPSVRLPDIYASPVEDTGTDAQPSKPVETPTEAIAAAFRAQVEQMMPDELRRGSTLLGPQRDDLGLQIDGAEARLYGSQGQHRTVVLALKLAEFQLIEDYVGEPPIVLLDDVMSDLDDIRRSHLLTLLRRRCQTFLTCTSLRAFPPKILAEAEIFHVAGGKVTRDAGR